MSDDKIKTVYMCQICHAQYDTMEKAEQCVKSHESDKYCCEIELGCWKDEQECCFHETGFLLREKDKKILSDEVKFSIYNSHPTFTTNCLDTPSDILAAKKRLIEAARKWTEKYNEVLAGLERELEAEWRFGEE